MLPLNYDVARAVARIDELTLDNAAATSYHAILPSQWQMNPSIDAVQCTQVGDPPSYRISHADEEVIFRFVGAIDNLSLPPFEKRRLNTAKLKYLQQIVSISTLQSTRAEIEWSALTNVLDAASRMVPGFVGNAWTPLSSDAAAFSNRVLVPMGDTQVFATCPIPDFVDPSREMRNNANICGLAYTDDNVVEYLQIVDDNPVPVSPASFRRGDVVEARFSVAIFRIGDAKFVTKLLLRAVISLDTSIASAAVRFTFASSGSPHLTPLKRKRIGDGASSSSLKTPRLAPTQCTEPETEEACEPPAEEDCEPPSVEAEAGDTTADIEMTDSPRDAVATVSRGVSNMTISPGRRTSI